VTRNVRMMPPVLTVRFDVHHLRRSCPPATPHLIALFAHLLLKGHCMLFAHSKVLNTTLDAPEGLVPDQQKRSKNMVAVRYRY
jgi:hypothetical protein